MCGIVGLITKPGTSSDRDTLTRMTETLTHRGPDAGGTVVHANVGLGHRRLSIIDLSASGSQPMLSTDGRFAIVFNGEIYNFRELKNELLDRGRCFRSHSDTEVLLEAWREYGSDCVRRLRGMFAFAIHDRDKGTLFLTRDRLGKKPLYYAHAGGCFLFGSEIKALRASGLVSSDIDEVALTQYVAYGHPVEERSIYSEIRKLPPAHAMSVQLGSRSLEPTISRYAALEFQPDAGPSEQEWLERTEQVLSEAVRLRMISDVPLGAFLSGGVDSSLVTALMCAESASPVKTFTIGFREKGFDESEKALAVARHLGTDHHCEIVTPEAVSALPELVATYDEPFGDPAAIPTLLLSKFARQQVTVALSGDGGDELFAGYVRYWKTLRLQKLARVLTPLGRSALSFVLHLLPDGTRGSATLGRLGISPAEQYDHAMGWRREYLSVLHPRLRGGNEARAYLDLGDVRQGGASPDDVIVQHFQSADLRHYLPDDILVKVDRASMRASLEVRSPLLDQDVAALAARIPVSFNLRSGSGKTLLKKLAGKFIPNHILDMPKQGFAVPLNRWFKTDLSPLLDQMIADRQSAMWSFFDHASAAQCVEQHRRHIVDSSTTLWRLVLFYQWSEATL